MEHYNRWLSSRFPWHFQRFHGQFAVRREWHCPADGFSEKQVGNNGKISPAFAAPDISDITTPDFVGFRYSKLAIKSVWDGNLFMTPRLYPCFSSGQLTKSVSFISQRPILRPLSVAIAARLLFEQCLSALAVSNFPATTNQIYVSPISRWYCITRSRTSEISRDRLNA